MISSNTRFDTTKASECAGGVTVGMGLWFELRADMVIVADRFNQNGPVRFSSGDGQKHSVYIVNPWPSGASTCTASGAAGIEFTSGVWTQDDKTSVLLYSARPIHVSTNPTFYGQMYGCTIVADTATNLTYLPAGSTVDPATMPWSLSYVRDRG